MRIQLQPIKPGVQVLAGLLMVVVAEQKKAPEKSGAFFLFYCSNYTKQIFILYNCSRYFLRATALPLATIRLVWSVFGTPD